MVVFSIIKNPIEPWTELATLWWHTIFKIEIITDSLVVVAIEEYNLSLYHNQNTETQSKSRKKVSISPRIPNFALPWLMHHSHTPQPHPSLQPWWQLLSISANSFLESKVCQAMDYMESQSVSSGQVKRILGAVSFEQLGSLCWKWKHLEANASVFKDQKWNPRFSSSV